MTQCTGGIRDTVQLIVSHSRIYLSVVIVLSLSNRWSGIRDDRSWNRIRERVAGHTQAQNRNSEMCLACKVKRACLCSNEHRVILHVGDAVTLVGWGTQVHVLLEVADLVQEKLNASCEVIDLVSILPWDAELVCKVISSL